MDASSTTPPNEEAILNNRLIELHSEIETLQHKLTTNIRDASRSRTKMEGIQNEIDNITNKGVSQEELVDLINSQEDLGNLINLEEEKTQTGPPAESDEDEWEMMPPWSHPRNKNKGGTIKNKKRIPKRFASRRRKITKRLMSRRKRYTRKQKK